MFKITEGQFVILMLIAFIFYLAKNPNEYYYILQQYENLFNLFIPNKPHKMKVVSANVKSDYSDKLLSSSSSSSSSSSKLLKISSNSYKNKDNIETWRDLAVNNVNANYHQQNPLYVSRTNLPIYYPISSPMHDTYFNHLNSISSPKLSTLRTILRKVEIVTNQGQKPIIYNQADRPSSSIKIDNVRIQTLANTICNLINQSAKSLLKVKYMETLNELHEETDEQSKINFDLKLELIYPDSENLGKSLQPDIIFIQSEFIFEKIYNALPEDKFFSENKLPEDKTIKFKAYLSKLFIIGSEHMGFLAGRFSKISQHKKR